jgi:hypothetical protein
MADDLTLMLLPFYDSAQLQPGGGVRQTTVVRYMLGKHGPFEDVLDRNPPADAINASIQQRRQTLQAIY